MKELTNENYPNHIDQDGKPIVGSRWGKEKITAVGIKKLFYLDNENVEQWEFIDNYIVTSAGYLPKPKQPSLQERVKAKFEDDETMVVEIVENDGIYCTSHHFDCCQPYLYHFLSRADCIGFVYHNLERDELYRHNTIIKCSVQVPVAVLLKKGG